jgi:hypothetical protein
VTETEKTLTEIAARLKEHARAAIDRLPDTSGADQTEAPTLSVPDSRCDLVTER